MHTHAHFALKEVWMTCQSLNILAGCAIKNLEAGIPTIWTTRRRVSWSGPSTSCALPWPVSDPLISVAADDAR
jgi:hypothetical protein